VPGERVDRSLTGCETPILHDGLVDLTLMPRNQHHPTPKERDERVKIDLPPDEVIKLVMETGPNPEDETEPNDLAEK